MTHKRSRLLTGLALVGTLLAGSQLTSFAQVGPPPLSLLNMAKFYNGLPQQDSALRVLEQQMNDNSPDLLRADSIASNLWRTSETLIGHSDILSQLSAENRTGNDPVRMALVIVGTPRPGAPLALEVLPVDSAESPSRVIITLERSGFLDDSIAGDRHRFDMTQQNGQWTIQRAGRQVRCQRGRGSQDFSAQLCS